MNEYCEKHQMYYRPIYNPSVDTYELVCVKCAQEKFVENSKSNK